ncbi:MAG: hypothetical protein CMH82_07625 [Nocardioides sp.]|nr:hypothetical protein [Nocardioides sp.]
MDTPLSECPDRQLGFRWPVALDQRLDQLVERAGSVGEKTNRRELLAADHDGADMSALIRKFTLASVGDAVLVEPGDESADVIEFRHHSPGPRTR